MDIRRNGERLLSESYGLADAAASRANTPDTRFRAGRVTEQFTAFAVLALQAQRLLTVADPVCRHLPTCPPAWRPITVEQLLLHTSGLPDYLASSPEELVALDAQGLSHLRFVEYLQGRPLDRAPGTWQHSASDYVVLGALIERLTSMPYGEYLKTTAFDPMGMTGTSLDWDRVDPAGRAVGYTADRVADPVPPARYADRALTTTAADLSRWNAFLITGMPLFGLTEARLRLITQEEGPLAVDASQGYGAYTFNSSARLEVHARGVEPGYGAFSGIRDQAGVSVVVLSNADSGKATELGSKLLTVVVGP